MRLDWTDFDRYVWFFQDVCVFQRVLVFVPAPMSLAEGQGRQAPIVVES